MSNSSPHTPWPPPPPRPYGQLPPPPPRPGAQQAAPTTPTETAHPQARQAWGAAPSYAPSQPPPPAPGARPIRGQGIAYQSPPKSSNTRNTILWVGAALVLALVAALFAAASGDDEAAYPDEWDPLILPYANYVASERGLLFLHPVYVDFIEDDDFRDSVAPDVELTSEQQTYNEQSSGFFRSIGLVDGDFDLAATSNDLTGDSTLAYYDFFTQRVTMRGTDMTVEMRLTLVHELTHALQDQHFGMADLYETIDSGQSEALDALIEGDAERISEAYYHDELTNEERAVVDAPGDAEEVEATFENYPDSLLSLFGAPYALGNPMAQILDRFGGQAAIDDAITDPPHDSEILIDPLAYLFGPASRQVPDVEVSPAEDEFESGSFGPMAWYLVLEQRLGAKHALAAVEGWGGDSYSAFVRGGVVCTGARVRGDDPESTAVLKGALDAWASAMPAGSATVLMGDEHIMFESCDPGTGVKLSPSPDAEVPALLLPVTRSWVALNYADAGRSDEFAACGARAFVSLAPVEYIASTDLGVDAPPTLFSDIEAACAGL